MHITKNRSKREDWDKVKSWNYKLVQLDPKMSVVYAEVEGEHGQVSTKESEYIYFVIEGQGEFVIDGRNITVAAGDLITIPPHTSYNYFGSSENPLKVVMFIDYWDN